MTVRRYGHRAKDRAGWPTRRDSETRPDIRIELDKRLVTVAGRAVSLTPTEYNLLRVLAQSDGRLLTHPMILREVWGPGYQEESNYLHVHVSQLRRKIEADPARPRHLLTIPGVGYRLDADAPALASAAGHPQPH
jgi:two-component system KDP operon response regulator KdpE